MLTPPHPLFLLAVALCIACIKQKKYGQGRGCSRMGNRMFDAESVPGFRPASDFVNAKSLVRTSRPTSPEGVSTRNNSDLSGSGDSASNKSSAEASPSARTAQSSRDAGHMAVTNNDTRLIRHANPYSPRYTPNLETWREFWPNVPHWGLWSSVRNLFRPLPAPATEMIMAPRTVVRRYQFAVLEGIIVILDGLIQRLGEAGITIPTHIGNKIVALRLDLYNAHLMYNRAIEHSDLKANIIFDHENKLTVGPLSRPLPGQDSADEPTGVYAEGPERQMQADQTLLHHFQDLKQRFHACGRHFPEIGHPMRTNEALARRGALVQLNLTRLRQERLLLEQDQLQLELTDFRGRPEPCVMIRYEDDNCMPMVRPMPYTPPPQVRADSPSDVTWTAKAMHFLGEGPWFQPVPFCPSTPCENISNSSDLVALYNAVPAISPQSLFALGSPILPHLFGSRMNEPGEDSTADASLPGSNMPTMPMPSRGGDVPRAISPPTWVFPRPLDPLSPRPFAVQYRSTHFLPSNLGQLARQTASRAALRRSRASRLPPRDLYLTHASSEFETHTARRRAAARNEESHRHSDRERSPLSPQARLTMQQSSSSPATSS